jgi:hypothetical protein
MLKSEAAGKKEHALLGASSGKGAVAATVFMTGGAEEKPAEAET